MFFGVHEGAHGSGAERVRKLNERSGAEREKYGGAAGADRWAGVTERCVIGERKFRPLPLRSHALTYYTITLHFELYDRVLYYWYHNWYQPRGTDYHVNWELLVVLLPLNMFKYFGYLVILLLTFTVQCTAVLNLLSLYNRRTINVL